MYHSYRIVLGWAVVSPLLAPLQWLRVPTVLRQCPTLTTPMHGAIAMGCSFLVPLQWYTAVRASNSCCSTDMLEEWPGTQFLSPQEADESGNWPSQAPNCLYYLGVFWSGRICQSFIPLLIPCRPPNVFAVTSGSKCNDHYYLLLLQEPV